jgi:hypothetical protein
MGLMDKLKTAATDKSLELLAAGAEKLRGTLDDLAGLAPQIEKVGYHLTDLTLSLGLSPSVTLHLTRQFVADEEAFQAVRLNQPDGKTLSILLKTLEMVNSTQRRLELKNRAFKGVEVELGLPPVVRMKFGEANPVVDQGPEG